MVTPIPCPSQLAVSNQHLSKTLNSSKYKLTRLAMFRNILMLSAYPMICTDFQNMGGIIANKKHGWVDKSRAPQDPQRAHHNKDPGPDVPASTQPKHGPGRRQRLFPFPLFTVMQFVNSECATNTGDQGRVHFRLGTIKDFI